MNESYSYPPPEVINLAQLDAVPRALALFLAFLAVASLVHALLVTGRARRRDLGVLRALGFTGRQTVTVLVVTTATIVAVGVVLGIPAGLLVGTTGWRLVASNIFVAPDSNFPVVTIALVAVAAVAGGLLIAALPARAPVRMQPAEALRAE
jgi:putative ABC transport system permease protein